jgi:hypothetical protein
LKWISISQAISMATAYFFVAMIVYYQKAHFRNTGSEHKKEVSTNPAHACNFQHCRYV